MTHSLYFVKCKLQREIRFYVLITNKGIDLAFTVSCSSLQNPSSGFRDLARRIWNDFKNGSYIWFLRILFGDWDCLPFIKLTYVHCFFLEISQNVNFNMLQIGTFRESLVSYFNSRLILRY